MPNRFIDQQRKLLVDLAQLVQQRAAGEDALDQQHAARDAEVLSQYKSQRETLTAEFEKEIAALRGEYRKLREETIYNYESGSYAVVQEAEAFDKHAVESLEQAQEKAKRQYQVAQRIAKDEFEEHKDKPPKEFQRFQKKCESRLEEFDDLQRQVEKVLRRRGCPIPTELPQAKVPTGDGDLLDLARAAHTTARARQAVIVRQPAPQFLERGWPFLISLFTTLGLAWPAGYLLGWGWGIGASVVVGVVAGIVVRQVVLPVSRKQTLAVLPDFLQAVAEGHAVLKAAEDRAKREAEQKLAELTEKRDHAFAEAHARWSRQRVELVEQHQERVKNAVAQFKARRKELQENYQRTLKTLDEKYLPLISQREQRFAEESQKLLDDRQQNLLANKAALEESWSQLVQQWTAGYADFQAAIDEMNRICDERTPAWENLAANAWAPGEEELPALRFGSLRFALDTLPRGVPKHERLQVSRTDFSLPAALAYPECPSIMYLADGEGRDLAIRSLQDVMLRLLTSLPPGKVRFTIIDPTGLGQNFSAFMHLADFDERLVSSRIWTEVVHINKRLADLTEHMENVIQKYLRNEFESIQEYNRHAGEVAEPFQILVVANFPANFNEESARRLVSIASSGARCGVYTLISVDTKLKLPHNFDVADLQSNAVSLAWDAQRFCLPYDGLRELPLSLDVPPDDDRFTAIVRTVGERAKDANRVEVPFGSIVPPLDDWWSRDSRAEIEVPLGRAGATNLQFMRLGKGTSQHVLISGKTGSGKSTLLHAMITSLSIQYSPDEVHFYLIDFKKGVEFKAYAARTLPHARVIAIESEREFGMSVLQRLDYELKRRGDLFRAQGVQDLKAFRDEQPDTTLPRILLIIDEFQEFFVKDDKIAQDAALLLDRLVRQGRAFGIHVLLGSQTLAGAYTLARSTIGQMAVRIALQCSETDAHLILSDDNTAARLLSRPGEAIYNDANGLFEGNHPFQVVWLPDHEREHYLERLGALSDARGLRCEPPIVFEGNAPAEPAKNEPLRACLEGALPDVKRLAPRAWLGAAVAIKDPACAVFRRQSGSNLLIVGQQEEMALGMLASSLVSLAAELNSRPAAAAVEAAVLPTDGRAGDDAASSLSRPRFVLLDGSRADSTTAGYWSLLARQAGLDLEVIPVGGIGSVVSQIADEVDRRLQAGEASAEPVFLIVYNLARFRALRKSDDFGFSFDEESAPKLDKQFATILREGPNLGVHTLIWCDNYNNVSRWIDRQSMHDVSLRVLFQMSGSDSANLMDTPEASRLGMHRAILYDEEQGEYERFRPYGLPDATWLGWVKERLATVVSQT